METSTSQEEFTSEERAILSRYFTNIDGPVFALVNLPEVVKGALFARYSRSEKSLKRLFLDEFINDRGSGERALREYLEGGDSGRGAGYNQVGDARARDLYDRIFTEYGDDSVAQLGGAHLGCENVSNIATKILERGRLMAYLEQSTRYIRYDTRHRGRFRYKCPPELDLPEMKDARRIFEEVCKGLFELYAELYTKLYEHFEHKYPKRADEPEGAYRSAVRAKVCDSLRGLLPAATLANVGVFGSGQAYERLLLRLLSSPVSEARILGKEILHELEKVIPSFVKRVEMEGRGVDWRRYLSETRDRVAGAAALLISSHGLNGSKQEQDTVDRTLLLSSQRPTVNLVDFDPEGERKIAAAILFDHTPVSMHEASRIAQGLGADALALLIAEYVGSRRNRRHLPGRAFESTYYTFEVVSDYGAFRDLQRHRILTVEWQPLSSNLGFSMPDVIAEIGEENRWKSAMESAADAYSFIESASRVAASYVLPMAFRLRYRMQLNAREAIHLIELRTSSQAHPEYRAVCSDMAELIGRRAGHWNVYRAMQFKGGDFEDLESREAEMRAATRKKAIGG